ncbi:hypothetical protein PQE68_gp053 [Bacillus phage vB_BanS_Sophrita]|uniref:Uncharacterized protein n=1 Tax=Bacillus phage vB_BanS_Sophrita TaxID=2894790 RepID=A0AAE8YX41_9CAUD|nr:hypothetical protein PQE68_gp053 [Bacillus phage vB_BanS_Sophrita]UGO50644.1 hypothetical protein SOPHRITA_53 [Bacillus phage vB_BanS_Sophrita]
MKFDITEIQYLRGLVMADKLINNYDEDKNTKIAQNKSMHDFTNEVLEKLDKMEDE